MDTQIEFRQRWCRPAPSPRAPVPHRPAFAPTVWPAAKCCSLRPAWSRAAITRWRGQCWTPPWRPSVTRPSRRVGAGRRWQGVTGRWTAAQVQLGSPEFIAAQGVAMPPAPSSGGPGQEVQTGKRDVTLVGLEQVGNYLPRCSPLLGRPQHRHLHLGLPVLPRLAAGQAVVGLRGKARRRTC